MDFEMDAICVNSAACHFVDCCYSLQGRSIGGFVMRLRDCKGFTLVELLLVMLALFCLGTVAIIAYARALGCTP